MIETIRHDDVFSATAFSGTCHVIGCGGVGGHVAQGLARLGVGIHEQSPIVLYDPDVFAPHNVANQWQDDVHIGLPKVRAAVEQMRHINPGIAVTGRQERINESHHLSGVVFLCIDTMADRDAFLTQCVPDTTNVRCVIETRMDAEVAVVHCFDPRNAVHRACWYTYWYSDEEAENLLGCGGHVSVISTVYVTAALALSVFIRFAHAYTAEGITNRVYFDTTKYVCESEVWPTA